jgi:hypothetical protein
MQPEPLSGSPQQEVATTVKKLLSHAAGAILEGGLVALLVTGLLVGTAFAAKGGAGSPTGGTTGGGTLALRMVIDNNGDGLPNWNDWITFDVSTTATDKPWVRVTCDGYVSSAGFFSSYAWNPYFDLASTAWAGGPNTCTATLFMYGSHGKVINLKSMTFGVNA